MGVNRYSECEVERFLLMFLYITMQVSSSTTMRKGKKTLHVICRSSNTVTKASLILIFVISWKKIVIPNLSRCFEYYLHLSFRYFMLSQSKMNISAILTDQSWYIYWFPWGSLQVDEFFEEQMCLATFCSHFECALNNTKTISDKHNSYSM